MRMSSERFAHCYAGTVQAETSVTTQLRENLTVAVVESGRSRAPIPVQQAFLNSARNKPIAGGTQTVRSAFAEEHSACMQDMHDVSRMTTCFRTHACVQGVDSCGTSAGMLMLVPLVAGATLMVTSQLGVVPSDSVMASAETGSANPLPRLGLPSIRCSHG